MSIFFRKFTCFLMKRVIEQDWELVRRFPLSVGIVGGFTYHQRYRRMFSWDSSWCLRRLQWEWRWASPGARSPRGRPRSPRAPWCWPCWALPTPTTPPTTGTLPWDVIIRLLFIPTHYIFKHPNSKEKNWKHYTVATLYFTLIVLLLYDCLTLKKKLHRATLGP